MCGGVIPEGQLAKITQIKSDLLEWRDQNGEATKRGFRLFSTGC